LKDFYYDTVNFNQGALKLAIDFAGADHVLAGSDYPHQIGSIPSMLDAISKLEITDDQREQIRWKNAARLLGLEGQAGHVGQIGQEGREGREGREVRQAQEGR
jgi:aminocarboxymuconate-semialdehyde decarboxylase